MLKLTAGIDPIEAAFHTGYASAIHTASDLITLTGTNVDQWMAASRNILTTEELAELAQTAAQILARRDGMAVAA